MRAILLNHFWPWMLGIKYDNAPIPAEPWPPRTYEGVFDRMNIRHVAILPKDVVRFEAINDGMQTRGQLLEMVKGKVIAEAKICVLFDDLEAQCPGRVIYVGFYSDS
ncbi:hypothetical protein [Zavarzinella formosa]|uniref:hypothetical protein n=1 Tax=Zavarzinella formosa TaxID=360055 RepID=UPI000301A01D|nr:hypothetical protein [Zavarzinella formosa]